MRITVAYYSKTGNTKTIADSIARVLGCDSIPINIVKHGRKTKQELDQEKQLFQNAINKCNQSDLVFIGTPTEFRKPHSKIIDLINNLIIKKTTIFCFCGPEFYDYYDQDFLYAIKKMGLSGNVIIFPFTIYADDTAFGNEARRGNALVEFGRLFFPGNRDG